MTVVRVRRLSLRPLDGFSQANPPALRNGGLRLRLIRPVRLCQHSPAQAVIRPRRGVKPLQKLGVGFGTDAEHRSIQQRILCGMARGFQYEVGAVLAGEPRGTIDQSAQFC